MTPEDYLEGQILLIDKPLKWSSFQAVNKLKFGLIKELKLPKKFKIGHAGTLDPLASGLLIICTGKFTKRIEELQEQALSLHTGIEAEQYAQDGLEAYKGIGQMYSGYLGRDTKEVRGEDDDRSQI